MVANVVMGGREWWDGMGPGAERGESRHVCLLASPKGCYEDPCVAHNYGTQPTALTETQ